MNYNLTMSVNTNPQFHQAAKLNMNSHFLNQALAPRFVGLQNLSVHNLSGLNASTLMSASSSISPPICNQQIKAVNMPALSSKMNALSLSQQQQPQQQQQISSLNEAYNMQRSFIAPNLVSPLNLNHYAAAQNAQNSLQKANTQSLIASVIAANTSCNLNNTLFVGNLHASLQEIDLVQVFRPFGQIVECCKKWLHFGFVKFTSEEEACHAYVTLNGFRLKGRPMRLEFQNRTKKARIKAILAQASMQANANGISGADVLESSFANLGLANLLNDTHQGINTSPPPPQITSAFQAGFGAQLKSDVYAISNDCSFFDPEQIMKFCDSDSESKSAKLDLNLFDLSDKIGSFNFNEKFSDSAQTSEESYLTSIKKHASPSDSPNHDSSCSLSSSSDSGCRSNSFSVDEDSGIHSLHSKASNITASKLKEHNRQMDKLQNICENGDANNERCDDDDDDNLSEDDDGLDDDCDTSDDASDIPSDTDSLADLDLDENFLLDEPSDEVIVDKFIQILEKDGSVARKKLDYGIYCSVNETRTLFIEPHDVLKHMANDEYEEYNLFPYRTDINADGGQLSAKARLYLA